jgi:cell division control protein 6
MARPSLGKRTRSQVDSGKCIAISRGETCHSKRFSSWPFLSDELQLPSKRPRRSVTASTNDENQDPAVATESVSADPLPTKRLQPEARIAFNANLLTPTTPRHRDALASSPLSTPRHLVRSAGKLFQRFTPQSPLSPTASQTVYHSARQLFSRGADPGCLIGREGERAQLKKFLGRCSSSKPRGCLYISGPPGTGKSAMVSAATIEASSSPGVRKAHINCMSVKSAKDLAVSLLQQLSDDTELLETDPMASLQKLLVSSKGATVYVVVLDEIDHILTMGLEALYRIFEWSLSKTSRLMLIGIANALDLTDRFLPRLKSKNLKPELLAFQPYTTVQIKAIITMRLQKLLPAGTAYPDYVPFMHPAAIELCSRKVSSQTGDLRKAFEICRRALDLVETETRRKHEDEAREKVLQLSPSRKPLGEKVNLASSRNGMSGMNATQLAVASLQALTSETAPRASISHLNKVTAAAFSNGTSHRLKALNLQQKAALCALLAIEKRNRAAKNITSPTTPSKIQTMAPSQKALFDTYCKLCDQDAILHPLSSSEFREVMGSLETLGLVNTVEGKAGSLAVAQTPSKRGRRSGFTSGGGEKRVASCVGEKEIEQVAEGSGADILRSILSGDALD